MSDNIEVNVDVHEDKLQGLLQRLGLVFNVSALPIGDIVKGDLVIERKTFSDFVSSVTSKRLFTQLMQMQDSYQRCYLCISGSFQDYNYLASQTRGITWTVEQYLGVLASISARYEKIKVLQVENDTQLAKLVVKLLEKSFDGKKPELIHTSIMLTRDKLSTDDVVTKMFMAIPKFSYTRAIKLRQYVNIRLVDKNGINITENYLLGIEGMGSTLAKKLCSINTDGGVVS